MEDSIEVILQDHDRFLSTSRPHPVLSACLGALLTGLYGVWSLFVMPGFRKVPWSLKVLEISNFLFLRACFAVSPPFQTSNAACLCGTKQKQARTEHYLGVNDNLLIFEAHCSVLATNVGGEENGKSITMIIFCGELQHLLQYVNLKCILCKDPFFLVM